MSIRCPKCGSDRVQYVASTDYKKGSVSKGCCGYIIFGPIGLLCGLCGSGSTTKKYWVCHNCGCEFQKGDCKSWDNKEDYMSSKCGKEESENSRHDQEECENPLRVLKQNIENLNTEIDRMQMEYTSYVNYFNQNAPDDWEHKCEETSGIMQDKQRKLDEAEKKYLESNQSVDRIRKIKNLVYVFSVLAAIAIPFIFTEVWLWILPGVLLSGLVYNMHKYYHLAYDNANPEELKNIQALKAECETVRSEWQSYNNIKVKYETMNKLPERISKKQEEVNGLLQQLDKLEGKK